MLSKIVKKLTEQIVLNVPGITEEKAEQIDYGLYTAFSDVLKLLAVLITAQILGKLDYALVAVIVFAVNKSYLGGVHAKTQLGCLITHFTIIFGSIYLSEIISIRHFNVILFLVAIVLAILYAPADLVTKPIITLKRKKELKIKGIIVLLIYFFTTFFTPSIYSNIISIITLISTFNVTPIMYKLTKNKRGGIV
ncbi:accessory gene regulator B family protein [Ruminiclostridium herbifermentans]|uniref:Accessory gene regulator B family protein n=1 Tax=Ruminiclostridium herbifermentans TaxID=2488810 RepID=A0A4V6ENM4_9FIRM|nr:accessory gene regulator B family protein [Ruminiclostridium herbifermentans]QNU65784.1 accessory gene regulator B family protein [Ruminiclostridium herbifermentans]